MRSLVPEGRWQQLGLFACAVIAVAAQLYRWDWLIDDAAICIAYARNLAAGEGFVAFPGGERVEGTSDPTWVALLTLFQLVGVDGFTSVKPLALLFTVGTLPLLWRAARDTLPEDDGTAALAAPFAFAVSAQVAIWGASGLENPLWSFLLAAALVTTPADARAGRFVLSCTCWLGLAWTRPEGIAYAAIGGAWWLLHLIRAGHSPVRPTLGWFVWFFTPTLALIALRWWYFAWPVPNTWYAKVGARPTYFGWNARGWNQIREWSGRLWFGWYAPLYQLGLVGSRGRAAAGTFALTALIALLLAWPGPEVLQSLPFWPTLPEPPNAFAQARMSLIVAAGVAYPLVALSRPPTALSLAWMCGAFSLAFSIYADGDWMGAFRWMSLLSAPAALLFAAGLYELQHLAGRWWDPVATRMATAMLLFGLIPPNASQSRDHATYNRNETPSMVAYRVRFTQDLVARTFFEGQVMNVDMDMGAHLWFAPEYVELDMAGLVDVPIARHWYQNEAFVEEYLFTEHQPTFAHVHGWWAGETRLRQYAWFQRWMVEVGPYVDQAPLPLHPGVFASRALFTVPTWPTAHARRVPFAGGLVLHGLEVPTRWAAGREGYLELGLSQSTPADLHALAFLSRAGRVVATDLPIGYGEYPGTKWLPDDIYAGRHLFRVPPELEPGAWDLGLVFLDAEGRVVPVADGAEVGPDMVVARGNDAVYAEGEVRFVGLVTIGTDEDVLADESTHRDTALADAVAGRCEAAEGQLRLARRTHPRDEERHAALRRAVSGPIGACYAGRAEGAAPAEAAALLAVSRGWDPDGEALARIGGPVGEELWAAGTTARGQGDAEAAYQSFSALLSFQPWRSWARKYAEEARDVRLGTNGRDTAPMQSIQRPE